MGNEKTVEGVKRTIGEARQRQQHPTDDAGLLAALRVSYQCLADDADRLRLQVAHLERERVLLTGRNEVLEQTCTTLRDGVEGNWNRVVELERERVLLRRRNVVLEEGRVRQDRRADIPEPAIVTSTPKRLGRCEICNLPTFGRRCAAHLTSDTPQDVIGKGQEGNEGRGKSRYPYAGTLKIEISGPPMSSETPVEAPSTTQEGNEDPKRG